MSKYRQIYTIVIMRRKDKLKDMIASGIPYPSFILDNQRRMAQMSFFTFMVKRIVHRIRMFLVPAWYDEWTLRRERNRILKAGGDPMIFDVLEAVVDSQVSAHLAVKGFIPPDKKMLH